LSETSETPDIRLDSEVRNDGVLINAITGLGTTKDKSEYYAVRTPRLLAEQELEALYYDPLCRRVIDIYAEAAVTEQPTIKISSNACTEGLHSLWCSMMGWLLISLYGLSLYGALQTSSPSPDEKLRPTTTTTSTTGTPSSTGSQLAKPSFKKTTFNTCSSTAQGFCASTDYSSPGDNG
jgi:hypothetical protein